MTPNKIKALLVEQGIKQAEIAAELNVSGSAVCGVIKRRFRSRLIEQYIAARLAIDYRVLWGEAA